MENGCALWGMELPSATIIHIHTLKIWAYLHTRATHVIQTIFECLENRPHIHIERWIPLHTWHTKMSSSSWISPTLFEHLAFLLTVYHETKIGRNLRYVIRNMFTQQTHTYTLKKNLGGCIFITQFLGVSFTQRFVIHMPFFYHASIVCLNKELRVVVVTFVKIENHGHLKKNCL